MKSKNANLIKYRVLLWISASLVTIFLGFVIFATCAPQIFKEKQVVLIVLFLVFAIGFTIAAVLASIAVKNEKDFLNQIRIENSYTLGEATLFYNLDAFKLKVNKMLHNKLYDSKKKFVVSFTPTALDISSNRGRDKILTSLNLKLANFLDDLFLRKDAEFDIKTSSYAFSRGVFFFFLIANDSQIVSKLINIVSNECFRMVNEDKVRIWVQPFFGIKVIENDESIVSSIEDSLIARDHSEKNYESYTYFKESFRDGDSGTSTRIAEALDNNEFVPYYQPKYSLKEHRYVSCEALARWKSPEHGIVPPAKFIDDAEKAGLLNAIDVRIFELAVKDISNALKRGRTVIPISVNFSLYEFFSRKFFDTIVDTLKKYDVPAKYIEIEITETTSQVNKFLSLSVIRRIKSLGIRVLMDDFGVGYSQIDNVRQIPFDAIKIDKSLMDRVVDDVKTSSIVKYLIELAHTNEMEAIAEGVETKEQLDILRRYKIDTVQGFYFSKPLPIEEYNELLRNDIEAKGVKR